MAAKPLHYSRMTKRQRESIAGYGADGARRMGYVPMPVQSQIWDLLEARKPNGDPLHETNAVEVPRRAGKTESLLAEAHGRCTALDDYSVLYTAQSGVKSRERFYGFLRRIQRHDPDGAWRPRESRGEERIEYGNGAIFRFAPPKSEAFRGDAVDFWIADEAQEVDEEDSADLLGSALPIFDTRPGAQLVVAGTAGETRSGLLWESLEHGRAGRWGILEYAAPDGMDLDDPRNWLKVHPGPAGVDAKRALEVLKKRFEQMSTQMFRREYQGRWPLDTKTAAFDADLWGSLAHPAQPQPARFALAFDVTPSGDRASVVAVWRDTEEDLWGEVVEDKRGSDWLPAFLIDLAKRRRVPVGYDTGSIQAMRVAGEVARLSRNTVTLHGLTLNEYAIGCASFSHEVVNGTFRHSDQPSFNDAIQNAARRQVRDGGTVWGRVLSAGSIAPVVAVSVGTYVFNEMPAPRALRALSARTG